MEQYENDSDYINSLRGKERYEFLLSQLDDEKLKSWVIEQENLKNKLSNEDDPMLKDIMYIGGMDISYDKKMENLLNSPFFHLYNYLRIINLKPFFNLN